MELSFKLVLLGCLLAAANAYNQPNSTVVSKTYIVNLDLPPYERWKDIVTIYKSSGPLIVDYFTGQARLALFVNPTHFLAARCCYESPGIDYGKP